MKAVFTHRWGSRYDDRPDCHYHFPRTYLRTAEKVVGDWVIYYEPRRNDGRQVYYAAARVTGLRPDPERQDHTYADIADYLEFPNPVPFRDGRAYFESLLEKPDGSTNRGAFGRSVRRLPDREFDAILRRGLATGDAVQDAAELAEPAAPFERPMVQMLTNRPFRDAAFARAVKDAYGGRCAISDLGLRNGGGAPEVEAAHIRPVAHGGSDSVRNGLALSHTLHWMFDRGLIAIAEDHGILVSHNKVPPDVADRLLRAERRLRLPDDPRLAPHPEYLRYHRERIYGQA